MKKEIPFIYPLISLDIHDFISCFTSIYMYIEGYNGTEDCYCGDKLAICNSCGGCKASLQKKHEELFCFFNTMIGCSSMRVDFDGENEMEIALYNSDEQIDYVTKIAGYSYKTVTNNFQDAIVDLINGEKPLLVRLKTPAEDIFRVISGYDDDILICPEFEGKKLDHPITYGNIDRIYVITDKIKYQVEFKEGLKKIIEVMEYNKIRGIWDDYIQKFAYWKNLMNVEFDEIKRRFNRMCAIAWRTFNSHYFGEAFCRELYHRTDNEALKKIFAEVRQIYWSTHAQCWQIIALNDCRDWSQRRGHELEAGLCDYVVMSLNMLKKNDELVLQLVKQAANI